MTLYSIGYIARLYGVSPSTIRRWCAKGKLTCSRTLGGHRRFEIKNETASTDARREVVGYARVSSHGQKDDLDRQIRRLRLAGCDRIISDIGSGLNCCKPGLKSLVNRLLEGTVERLVVIQEDRLLRFGVNLIRQICARMQTDLQVLDARAVTTFEEELARDVITLMTVFCARLYGRRSGRNKRISDACDEGLKTV